MAKQAIRQETGQAGYQAGYGPALSLKVSEKGAVSLYGLRRFPATFYKDEWLAILDKANAIRAFIKDNEDDLKGKPAPGIASGGTAI